MLTVSDRLDPSTAEGSDWVCAHIFYDTDQDLLLTDCVRPLVGTLTDDGLVQRYFFLRYWEGGPHVRLRLLPARTADRAEVERRAVERIEAFLARSPAPDVVDRSHFAQVAEGLAGLEGRSGHDQVVRANNTVELRPYEREHADYGYGAAIGAVEQHFFESSELAQSVVAAGTTVEQRALLAFDLVIGVFALCDEVRDRWARHGGPPLPFGSGPEAADVEPRYRAQRAKLRERALRTWHLATRPTAVGDQRAYWLASVRRLRDELHSLEEAGGFVSEWADSPLAGPLDLAATDHPATSLVLLRCAHLVNNRLGLTLWQENQLRFLVGRVLAELPEALAAS
ncbi:MULTISPECIES: lantibiotic dehydratase C-terminal domain-containing protein [unclassified Streptomyces]|uniref:lantibiotic dehydratase C-terminal domain-containing protein n=1 Tax=unclassified Streptomyces TaxID=2593676 RepID=UPI002258D72E|nr:MULTISPECIES: lantibiotic dehydratase C-terminal domain-containing protein [unclassified Streptomyces]MCX4553325.1 lantibiotic biosynthesis protein [Streptomyces sp. NBC_01500]WSC18287.1 lantibiotic biosynthesis protein [Streptomyces sp. NBC_01766]